ncbi:MAG: glycosyltransferase family 39 protein [Candidatus Promineifilaceae bacterium]|nr:glycosyltransferase family 39 protein [Candidatus Promineifilaceae bacterium]
MTTGRTTASREVRDGYWLPLFIFVTAIAVTLLFWAVLPSSASGVDSGDYLAFYKPVGKSIAEGEGLRRADGSPAIRYPPGYPLLLAGVFAISDVVGTDGDLAVNLLILLSMAATAVLLYLVARTLWGPWLALAPALLWISYPFALWATKQPLSETPFTAFFLGSFALLWWLIDRSRTTSAKQTAVAFSLGLLIGYTMLIRPVAIGLPFIFGALILLLKTHVTPSRRLLLGGALFFGSLLVVVPWEAWLHANTGRFILLSSGGPASIRDGLTFAVYDKGYREEFDVPGDVVAFMEDVHARRAELNTTGAYIELLVEETVNQPATVGRLLVLKMARSWYGTDSGRYEHFILPLQLGYLLLIGVSSVFAWRQGGDVRKLLFVVCVVVLYFWGMTVLVLSTLRYLVPAFSILFLLVPATLQLVYMRACRRYSISEQIAYD